LGLGPADWAVGSLSRASLGCSCEDAAV
jgi:hypothetical protein